MTKAKQNPHTRKKDAGTGMIRFMIGFVCGVVFTVGLTWFGFDAAQNLAAEKVSQGFEALDETRYLACRRNYLKRTGCLRARDQATCEGNVRSLCQKGTVPSLPRTHKEPAGH